MSSPARGTGPNADQIRYWNEQAGPKWVTLQDFLDPQIRPLGEAAMERLDLQPGQRVLDMGCGCGSTTLELGRRVGPEGEVTGVDISAPMLGQAKQAADDARIGNVRFEQADLQVHSFPPESHDRAFSRFGVMFFSDPVAAFANVHRSLQRGGRMAFVSWQPLLLNPWMAVPLMAALPHLPPQPVPEPNAPGPFGFADAERVQGILREAGWDEVAAEALEQDVTVGAGFDLERIVDFMLQMGPAGRALLEVDEVVRRRVAEDVREALLPYVADRGLCMPAAAWIYTAKRID